MTPRQDVQGRRRVLLGLFVVLFLLQQAALLWLYWSGGGKLLLGDEATYLAWARSLIGQGSPPAPTGWWPPLQAWLMAGVFRVFGENLLLVQLLQTALLIGAAALLRAIWRDVDGRVRAANLAAALFLLNPSNMGYAHWLWPEPVHLFLLLAALRLAQHGFSTLRGLGAGAALGAAMLAKSLLSLFWPFILLLQWRRGGWRGVAALLLGVGVVIAVPLWQGWQQTGKPMIADSSAFNLVGGLTDRWRSDYVGDSVVTLAPEYLALAPTIPERNAIFQRRAEDLVRQQGLLPTLQQQLERQYFRLFSSKTLLLTQLPGPICAGHTGSYRPASTWLPQSLALVSDIFHLVTLAGFALGLAFWRRWREPLVWWAALFFAYQLGLYLLLHVKARFLLPFMPFLCAFAGSAIATLLRPGDAAAAVWLQGRWRWVAAVVMGCVLLGLALLGPWLDQSCG